MKTVRTGRCLEDEEFYQYIAGKTSGAELETHLASCADCRKALAELLQMMDASASISEEDLKPLELSKTLETIRSASRPESGGKKLYRYGPIAAGLMMAIGLSLAGFYLYNRIKSQSYCDEARLLLQQVYQARSPSDLRLDLPFLSNAAQRSVADNEAIGGAERLFHQALGVREGLTEAMLGLGYLNLEKNQFTKAESEFQRVLQSEPSNSQALLGRGVSRFEAGMASTGDPIARKDYLDKALADFESLCQSNPRSLEARYNKIQVLYNVGRHKEALGEIETYLSQDARSIWAAKLKDLKFRMQTNSWNALLQEIRRAALHRDAPRLDAVVRVAPERVTVAVTTLFRDALAAENLRTPDGAPDSNALNWAAQQLTGAYQSATGDDSFAHLIHFYAGLSPPQRRKKQKLDARLEELIQLYDKNEFQAALQGSEPLLRDFSALGDYWQLVRAYQLRGNCWYLGKTDFSASLRESREMLKYAELARNRDLIARSLHSLSTSYSNLGQSDNEFLCLSRLEQMAETPQMNYLKTNIHGILGRAFLNANQLDRSLQHFLSCLANAYRLMDAQNLIASLEGLGTIMERRGLYPDALRYYQECKRWVKAVLEDGLQRANSEPETQLLNVQNRIGNLALKMKDFETAETQFREALQGRPNRLRELEARNRLGLARVYFEKNQFALADAEVGRVLDLATENSYREVAWQADNLKGMLLRQRGDEKGALGFFMRSAQTIETIRTDLPASDLRQSFLSRRYDPYRNIVSSLFHSNTNPVLALSYVDRAKAKTLRESLFPEAAAVDASRLPLLNLSQDSLPKLPPGILALEYFFGANELFGFLSGEGKTKAVSIPVSLENVERMVRKHLESIKKNDASAFDRLSRELYAILIKPLPGYERIAAAGTIAIMPDGPLHRLPFASLKNEDGAFLLEQTAISYAPSRSVLRHCLDKRKPGKVAAQSSILLLDGAANLRGASREIASIANLYPTHRLISDPDSPVLHSSVGDFEIIHFSGHAELHRGAPRLVFHTPSGEKYLDSQALQEWRLKNNKLVALAGCNTGVGPIFDGETPWSLAPSLLGAGAPSILVSLLPVDDFATASLTCRFYELLARGDCSKAQALRSAQLSLLNSEARHRPASWAPFVLLGNPD